MNHATALTIVDKIIANLCSRRGFYQALDIDEDIMEELREDLAGIVSQQWLPIDSAPRDGSCILGYGPYGVEISYYNKQRIEWESHCGTRLLELTHWMPLPEPPKD